MKRLTTKTIILTIIVILQLPSLEPITRIHIQGTQWLAHLREPAYPEHKIKIELLHYDVLYIYMELSILKWISEEKHYIKIE